MFKSLLTSFFLIATSLMAAAAPSPVVPSPSVVIIKQPHGMGKCTAVHIGNGSFLSAKHCYYTMKYPSNFEYTLNDEPVYLAWAHEGLDIVMVQSPTVTDLPVAEPACRDPQLGESVVVEGNNSEWGWIRSEGKVIGLKVEYEDYMYSFLHNANSVGGMSGGPIWDSSGKLLGINAATVNENPSMVLANPLPVLCINIPGTEEYKKREEKRKKNK